MAKAALQITVADTFCFGGFGKVILPSTGRLALHL